MSKEKVFSQFKWYLIAGYSGLLILFLLAIFTDIFTVSEPDKLPPYVWAIGGLLFLIALIALLAKTYSILEALSENGAMLKKIAESLAKNNESLAQIQRNTSLSETAKAIASRDADRQSLREAVLDKLHQQDFDATYEIIDEIDRSSIYQELARQLRAQADAYREATDTERTDQVIAHIAKMFEKYQWTKASVLIEKLINAYPKSEQAKGLRQKLLDKKEERKKALLSEWDDAVKRQVTDSSLEILKELDLYLTPNEGLALQEAARDVFRNKLHNLGVEFSMAVSERQWIAAVDVGRQIMRDFPNSKMSDEIRSKMDILTQRASGQM